jgi:hypothetical protein
MILPPNPPDLSDGDFAIVNAQPAVVTTTPEPDTTLILLVGSFVALIFTRRLRPTRPLKTLLSAARFGGTVRALFAIAAILLPALSYANTLSQNTPRTQGRGWWV